MNRWLVDGQIKIYADTRDKVYSLFPEALSVEPYEDNSYLEIIDIIKSKAIKSYIDYKGDYVYHIPHLDSYIKVKLLHRNEEYLDADYEYLITEGYCDYKSYKTENSSLSLQWTEKGRKWLRDRYAN